MLPFLSSRSALATQTGPASCAAASGQPQPGNSPLLRQTAGTAVASLKWAAAAGLAASLAGLDSNTALFSATGALALGGIVWAAEMAGLAHGEQLPHVTLQHGICNELHTLAGGLLGSTPVAAALAALACTVATNAPGRPPQLDANALAFVTAVVGAPAVLLLHRGMRAITGDDAAACTQALPVALPLLAAGAVLAAPAALLHQAVSPEAATRFVIGFGAAMAGAAVREALTQTTAGAWTGVERNGAGLAYGLRQAQGLDRPASTVAPTLASCLLFAGSSALLLHELERLLELGMAPPGQALLSLPALEVARRTALRSLLLQSANELVEGILRCLPLAAYARLRGIALLYKDAEAGLADVPSALRQGGADRAAWDRAALFCAARMLDGALPNLLTQLAGGASGFWNGCRIAAALAQGATMARTPLLAAHALPRMHDSHALPPHAATADTAAACIRAQPAAAPVRALEADAQASLPDQPACDPTTHPGLAWA